MHFGIVTGLHAEAELFGTSSGSWSEAHRYSVACAGPGGARAQSAALRLVASGCNALLSWGLAGGLSHELAAGDIVFGWQVATPDSKSAGDNDSALSFLYERLAPLAPRQGTVFAAEAPLATASDKRQAHNASGAQVVDMESGAVSAAAATAGLPFAFLRCVIDPASFSMPRSAIAGMGEDGNNRPLATTRALLAAPWELPALMNLARNYRIAMSRLRAAAGHLSAT